MADGAVLRASADENADLFWAIRGGGGNFGIATSLEYNLHKVGPVVTGGVVAHPLSSALDVLKFFRDTCGRGASDCTRWIECEARRCGGGALRAAQRR